MTSNSVAFFSTAGAVIVSGIRPRGQLSLPWSVIVETVSPVSGVVIGDELLVGGYSGPRLLCGRTYEKTGGFINITVTHRDKLSDLEPERTEWERRSEWVRERYRAV